MRKHAYADPGARIALTNKIITFLCLAVRGGSNRSDVNQPQLDALLTLPAVNRDVTSRVQNATAVLQQSPAEWLTHRPKGNGVYKFSVAGSEASPNVVFADRIGVDERVRRDRQQWLWIACAEWSRPCKQIRQ